MKLSPKQKNRISVDKYRSSNPWIVSYLSSFSRCNNPKNPMYIYYGGKGIKMLMKKYDFRFLWFRDKAYLLKSPSIDRIDANRDYIISNCRYIELSDNSRRAGINRIPPNRKLSKKEILNIIKRYSDPDQDNNQTELAKEYGVHQATISYIINRKTYKNI